MSAAENVLLVDDEENLLKGLRRQMRGKFNVVTAVGGEAALKCLEAPEPVAVVVCDMRMPGLDGVQTLEAFRKKSPETVRIMLTGNADQQTAVDAINTGQIFRFFSKPCPIEDLTAGIEDALRQYRLHSAEKELLETTMAGSVKLLADVVSLMDPTAAGQSEQMADWAKKIGQRLKLDNRWELNFAVMLAPLGRVSVPPEVLVKHAAGEVLSKEERSLMKAVPEAGATLIANIPRMAGVAEAVRLQDKNFDGSGSPEGVASGASIPVTARVLRVLKGIAQATDGREPTKSVFDQLEKNKDKFDPEIFEAARQCLTVSAKDAQASATETTEYVLINVLREGHKLLSDIEYEDGRLVLARGTRLSGAQIERLRALAKVHKIKEPIHVTMTAKASAKTG